MNWINKILNVNPEQIRVWVNVDIPTQKCTLHTNPSCTYVIRKKETPYKGVEQIKRDGGWLAFPTVSAARNHCETHYNNYRFNADC